MTARMPWEADRGRDDPVEPVPRRRQSRPPREGEPPQARGEAASQALARFREEYERRLAEERERAAARG